MVLFTTKLILYSLSHEHPIRWGLFLRWWAMRSGLSARYTLPPQVAAHELRVWEELAQKRQQISFLDEPSSSEVSFHSLFQQCVCMLSHFSCVYLFATLWTIAYQVPLSMGFSRHEYWSGLLCPPLRDLPDPRIEPASLKSLALVSRFFAT